MKPDRRDMIKASAQRVSRRRVSMRKPGRTSGRWVRLPSHTVTVFDADVESVKRIVEDALSARAGEVDVPGNKVHIQLTPKVLRD